MSYLNHFSHAAIVKSYTKLMLISKPKFAQLMARISISNEINTLEGVVQAIEEWYTSGFPANSISLLESLEHQLTIIDVDEADTSDELIKEFFEAVKVAKTGFCTVKESIGGEEYLRIIPNVEEKTCRISATDQDPEKEVTTCSYPDGVTVRKTTYFWGKYLNVSL